ncbi:hydroxymethylglutaryl-CoA synthase [Galactobacter sp.]|uniref:hydroxymethylglutaryl-CoA synthase n=1 Tax=Galactobacter sp. TaxID=2676125 RepID=UPI0025BB46FF|nr:hydroxymethylglutaryl-CoA synthase [Galactobacter sp.]
MTTSIGIHDIAFATTHHVLALDDLANATGVDPNKFKFGLGQEHMSIPAPDEDAVTLGAAAAKQVLDRHGSEGIRTVFFATESGVDQSKSAGVFAHGLLGLPRGVRVVEFKQACYSGTAALQAAVGLVARNPQERVLVIASDVARYAIDTPAEPTQGAGAVAMLVTADPAIAVVEPINGVATIDVNDFWRPNDSSTPLVAGALSVSAYLDACVAAWDDYAAQGGVGVAEIDRFVHHQPYTKMARKAHKAIAEHLGVDLGEELIEESFIYNRQIGNTYTASAWIGLISLLHHNRELAGKRIGLFSYGSGSVGEFLTLAVQDDYRAALDVNAAVVGLDSRVQLTFSEYRDVYAGSVQGSADTVTPESGAAPFRLTGVVEGARQYARV